MTRFPKYSVGQQLGIGFGLMFLLLALLGAAVYIWQSQSAGAQREFLERIAPLAERSDQLERALLRLAIAGRNYLLHPVQSRMNQFEEARAEVESSLDRLEQLPKEADSEAIARQIARDLRPYLLEANRVVKQHLQSPLQPAEEARLSELRERTTELVRRLADLQRGKMATAISTMQASRDRVSDGIAAAIIIGGLLCMAIAWVTAQSVRRPVNELVTIAGSLEAGDWKPASQLVPETRLAASGNAEAGELRQLARAIGAAAAALQQREHQLQAQNEELQAQNEEIQSQAEELQAQHEEIQAQNEQLKRQAEALGEADQRKTRFLGVLAHELRNPMAPISNSLALLKRSPPGSEHALRAQAMIERQAKHLVRLIDDLLDVTRISQGKIRLQREELDLEEIVRACIEDQHAALESGERSFSFIAPEVPVRMNGDRTRLSQIVGNLLSNAVKFTDRGGRITLELGVESGEALLRVRDDGIGLEPELVPQLFQPFTQGATSLDRAHSGLGLGLSLVQSLAELHGGTVSAHSDGPGLGSEFVVRLPILA